MKYHEECLKTSLFQEKPWYQSKKNSLLSKILSISAKIISHLPHPLRKHCTKWIDTLGLFIIRLLKILPFSSQPYHHIKGLSEEKEPVTIMYKGNLPSIMFFLKRIFPDKNNIQIVTYLDLRKNHKTVKKLQKNSDMRIFEKDYFFKGYYQKKGYLIIPENISFELQITKPTEQIIKNCSHSIQQDLKKAMSVGYHYSIEHDLTAFTQFYKTMYLPYVTWKFQETEKIISFDAMKHFALRNSKLLLVRLENHEIFGGIFEIKKQQIITQYAGIKQGKFDHLHNGIIALSYYFLIEIARKKDIKSIDFGTSSPFIHDGLCKYKMRWNMNVQKTKPIFSTIFAININKNTPQVQSLFKKNPFFYYKNNELSPAIYVEKEEDVQQETQKIVQQNHLKRIKPTLYQKIEDLGTKKIQMITKTR